MFVRCWCVAWLVVVCGGVVGVVLCGVSVVRCVCLSVLFVLLYYVCVGVRVWVFVW